MIWEMLIVWQVAGERPQEQVFKDVQRSHEKIIKDAAVHTPVLMEDRKGITRLLEAGVKTGNVRNKEGQKR